MPLDPLTEELYRRGLMELLRMRLVREVKVATPAAGAQWSQVVPGGVIWELLSIEMTLTTSAIVANRIPTLRILDADGNFIMRFATGATIAAGATREISMQAGYGISDASAGNQTSLPSPPAVLLPSWSLQSLSTNFDAGDQWSAIILSVRVWSESQVVLNAQQIGLAVQSLTVDK